MEGSKLPNELLLKEAGSIICLKPYLVHLVSLESIFKTSDGYVYFDKDYYQSEPVANIHTRSKVEVGSWGSEVLFMPVTSFDGYNVLMIENTENYVKDKFILKSIDSKDRSSLDRGCNHFIDAFSIKDVETDKLTDKGMKQFKLALVALEDYETLMGL